MHFQLFPPSVYLLLVPIVYGQGLIEILNTNGYTEYAQRLQAYPQLLSNITSRNDVTIYAPLNGAPRAPVQSFSNATFVNGTFTNGTNTLRRRDEQAQIQEEAELAEQAACEGPPPISKNEKRQLSGVDTFPDSNFRVQRTFVRDPAYINLGPDQPVRIVQNYAGPAPNGTEARVEVKSGAGAQSNSVGGPYKYDKGIIYGVDSYFKLPPPLEETLSITGLTGFSSAIKAAGLTETLSNTPAITIFAPVHIAGTIDIKSHVIENTIGFIPNLILRSFTTQAGTKIKITLSDDGKTFYVNGIRIIRTDISSKNGVVHAIEKPLAVSATPQQVPPTGSAVGLRLGQGMLLLSLATVGYMF